MYGMLVKNFTCAALAVGQIPVSMGFCPSASARKKTTGESKTSTQNSCPCPYQRRSVYPSFCLTDVLPKTRPGTAEKPHISHENAGRLSLPFAPVRCNFIRLPVPPSEGTQGPVLKMDGMSTVIALCPRQVHFPPSGDELTANQRFMSVYLRKCLP